MAYVRKTPVKVPKPVEEMRIGAMLPAELEASLEASLGDSWSRAWCKGTGQFNSTLRRYLDGAYPIPQYVAVIVEMLATYHVHGMPVPMVFSLDPCTEAVSPLAAPEYAIPPALEDKTIEKPTKSRALPRKTLSKGRLKTK